MLPIGVATTYSVPGLTPPPASGGRPFGLVLGLSLMGVIVGGGAQPLQPAPTPENRPLLPLVALLLPLSGPQQALGVAVRDGFMAACLEPPGAGRCRVLLLDEALVSPLIARAEAQAAGAQLLVGPLLKESVQAFAVPGPSGPVTTSREQIPVLALNNLAEGTQTIPKVWQFGLAPEDEAREIAARASVLGQRRALVLTPTSEWGQRLLAAFRRDFERLGGSVVDTRAFLPGETDFTVPLSNLLRAGKMPATPLESGKKLGETPGLAPGRRMDVDLILVGANSHNGPQIMPQLKFFGAGDLPTYSTSGLWEDGGADNADLNGAIFPDSPWVIAPDDRVIRIKSSLVRHGNKTLSASRLYALGYDAYGLVPHLLSQPFPGPFSSGTLPGVTGLLYGDPVGRIHRQLPFAQIRSGRPVVLPNPLPPVPLAP